MTTHPDMIHGADSQASAPAAELNPSVEAEGFVRDLGAFSSHPRYQGVRWRLLRGTSALCGMAVVGGIALIAWNALSFSMLFHFSSWVETQADRIGLLVACVVFILAFNFTLALQVRMACIPGFAAGEESNASTGRLRTIAGLLLLLTIAAAAPALGARITSGTARFMINACAALPLPLLMVYIEWADETDRGGNIANLRMLRLGAAFGFGLAIASLLSFNQWIADWLTGGASEWIARRLGVLPWESWIQSGSSSLLKDTAPPWLRDALAGGYGENLRNGTELLLKDVAARVSSGAQATWAGVGDTMVAAFAPAIRAVIRVLLILATVPLIFSALALTTRISRTSVDDEGQYAPPRPGLIALILRSLVSVVRGLLGLRDTSGGPAEAADPGDNPAMPAWVSELKEAANRHELTGIESASHSIGTGVDARRARPSADAALAWLFDGRVPTEDQADALRAFSQRYVDYAGAIVRSRDGQLPAEHPDLLVQSDPGAGCSSTLRAMAIYAAAVRGQHVLLLCGSDDAASACIRGIRHSLEQMMLDGLVRVCGLGDPKEMAWCGQADGKPDSRPSLGAPEILVATAAEWDAFAVNPGFDPERHQRAIVDIEVMLIDDFARLRGSITEPLHLPFIVGRHRLLLASEARPFQLVMGTPVMEGQVAAFVASRLFGGNFEPSSVVLRRWIDMPPVIDIEAATGALPTALKHLTAFLLDRGLNVLVYQPGAGDDVCEELRQTLRSGDRQAEVVSDRDRLPASQRASFDAVIYRRSFREEHSLTIAARLASGDEVYLRIHERGAVELPTEINPMPVLSSILSRDVFIEHLRRSMPFMEAGLFVDRQHWSRFGLPWPDRIASMFCLAREQFEADPSMPSLVVDPPQSSSCDIDGAWPAIAVERGWPRRIEPMRSLDFGASESGRLEQDPDGSHLVLGRTKKSHDPRRFLTWRNQQNQVLEPPVDLAHLDRLLKSHGRSQLLPTDFSEVPGTDLDPPLQRVNRSVTFRGMPEEPYIPVLRIRLDLEPHAKAAGPENGPPPGAEWYSFAATARPIQATVSVIATMNERQQITPRSPFIEFQMESAVSAILVGMPIPHGRERIDRVRALLSGRWTTEPTGQPRQARAHWPCMTRAINAALRAIAPELPSFGRVVAFRPPRGGEGCCILLIEPIGTGGTVKDALSCIFGSEALRRRFCGLAERELTMERPSLHGAFVEYPEATPEREKLEAQRLLRLLCGADGAVSQPWVPSSGVGVVVSPAPASDEAWTPPEVPEAQGAGFPPGGTRAVESTDTAEVWDDYHPVKISYWCGDRPSNLDERPITYGAAIKREEFLDAAKRLNGDFGYRKDELEKLWEADPCAAHEYLRQRGMNEDLTANYAWIVDKSIPVVRDLANRILALAEDAGASSMRAKVAALYTFVIAHRYEKIGSLPDGLERWGVRVPAEMLHLKAGDCDSAALLLLAMIRASGLGVRAGVVVTHNHAMLGIELPVTAVDDHAAFPDEGKLVLLECTEGNPECRRIGRISREFVGTAVQLVNFG